MHNGDKSLIYCQYIDTSRAAQNGFLFLANFFAVKGKRLTVHKPVSPVLLALDAPLVQLHPKRGWANAKQLCRLTKRVFLGAAVFQFTSPFFPVPVGTSSPRLFLCNSEIFASLRMILDAVSSVTPLATIPL